MTQATINRSLAFRFKIPWEMYTAKNIANDVVCEKYDSFIVLYM